ncbi:Bis(5'-nucleosyl)-tetraphosphatase, symmetrical [Gammaproteobacteria bacterium]
MATYAIGDIQGGYEAWIRLLEYISFTPKRDRLWLVGDLVNRGPSSLAVLRLAQKIDAEIVLGNHDLHFLAVAHDIVPYGRKDTFEEVLRAPDRDSLVEWLCHRPLLHHDPVLQITMVHAGLAPQWDLAEAQMHAQELEAVLRGPDRKEFFKNMYGDEPECWSNHLSGWERLRFISNIFTRLRFFTSEGAMDMQYKGTLDNVPPDKIPWFLVAERKTQGEMIVCGHWSTLGYRFQSNVHSLDSGCVWGGKLSALRLDGIPMLYQVDCPKCAEIE